ncbi:hypothetical protein B0H17DRAFT_933523 [Mycena rosella]|uniref:NmrA-like domain-containing protein n=1 Tax=Mycena rosella TaxID=1033263 RepID=A0AAD7DMI4_MYCRO|nr:hypothetical protein B0H17DRAFT_933523 [Mycena rosella]
MPVITIFGATGGQGTSVLNAVLADGTYTPRAVSRSLDSAKSKALMAKGIQVVKANLFDVESVKAAIRGNDAVFGVHTICGLRRGGISTSLRIGKNLVDAAKEVGVKFFIWSSLPNATKLSDGLYKHGYHVDNKAEIEDYLKASGVPYAALLTCWFAENLWNFGSLQKTDTGYTIPAPNFGPADIQTATWVAHDFGPAAVALLSNYTDPMKGVLGNAFLVISMQFTYPELAAAIAAALKKEVTFTAVETVGVAGLDEMFHLQATIGMYSGTPVPNPALVALGVQFGSMAEFIKAEVVPRFA